MLDAIGPILADGGWVNFAKLGAMVAVAFAVPPVIKWVIWIRKMR